MPIFFLVFQRFIITMAIIIYFSLLLLTFIQLFNNIIHPIYNFILFLANNFHSNNYAIRIIIIFPYSHDHLLYSLINLLQFPHQSQVLLNQLISIYFLLYKHIVYFVLYLFLCRINMWIPYLP